MQFALSGKNTEESGATNECETKREPFSSRQGQTNPTEAADRTGLVQLSSGGLSSGAWSSGSLTGPAQALVQ